MRRAWSVNLSNISPRRLSRLDVPVADRNTIHLVFATSAPISVFGNTVLVPAGGPKSPGSGGGGNPQLVAYTVP